MINRVSAIFEVDLKDFRDALDSMEIYSISYSYKKGYTNKPSSMASFSSFLTTFT